MSARTDAALAARLTDLIRAAGRVVPVRGWIQNRAMDETGQVCVSGAVRVCAHTPAERSLALAVLRSRDHAEEWNDAPGRTLDEIEQYLAAAEVTPDDCQALLGPAAAHIETLLTRAAALPRDQQETLAGSGGDDLLLARSLAGDVAAERCRAAVPRIEVPPYEESATGGIGDAVWALATRDLIGTGGYTGDDYATLTRAWVDATGVEAHPDDRDGRAH